MCLYEKYICIFCADVLFALVYRSQNFSKHVVDLHH